MQVTCIDPHRAGILKSFKPGVRGQLAHPKKSPLMTMLWHFKQKKKTLGTQKLTSIGSKPVLGPSLGLIILLLFAGLEYSITFYIF